MCIPYWSKEVPQTSAKKLECCDHLEEGNFKGESFLAHRLMNVNVRNLDTPSVKNEYDEEKSLGKSTAFKTKLKPQRPMHSSWGFSFIFSCLSLRREKPRKGHRIQNKNEGDLRKSHCIQNKSETSKVTAFNVRVFLHNCLVWVWWRENPRKGHCIKKKKKNEVHLLRRNQVFNFSPLYNV